MINSHSALFVFSIATGLALILSACIETHQAVDESQDSWQQSVSPNDFFVEPSHLDHEHFPALVISNAAEAAELFSADNEIIFQDSTPFQRISFLLKAPQAPIVEARIASPTTHGDSQWSQWQRFEITWEENDLFVGRIFLEHPTTQVQLRAQSTISEGVFEFYATAHPQPDRLTRNLPKVTDKPTDIDDIEIYDSADPLADNLAVKRQAIAPRSLVIPRSEWGARDPDKICGNIATLNRMSIHHTAIPESDMGDAAARLRAIQASHIDGRGWCDIGYHFVVAQSGDIYQGRSDERRPGAHVAGHNTGNVGISFIANFEHQIPTETQYNSGASIMRWLHETYDIPLNRETVKGHREWPGQSTACPGSNMLNNLEHLVSLAATPPSENNDENNTENNLPGNNEPGNNDPGQPGTGDYNAQLAIPLDSLENFYPHGSSLTTQDSLPGESFTAEIMLRNHSDIAFHNIQLGYEVSAPYLSVASIRVNNGNEVPVSHAPSPISVDTLEPDQLARVTLKIDVRQYGFGSAHKPGIRAWVQNIDDIYGPQTSYEYPPATNRFGHPLRAESSVDILSPYAWHFEGSEPQDFEGWIADPQPTSLIIEPSQKMLSITALPGIRLVSPTWTSIPANRYNQLVLRVRNTSPHATTTSISWSNETHQIPANNTIRVSIPNDSQFHTLVIPIAEHPNWRDNIQRLSIIPHKVEQAPVEQAQTQSTLTSLDIDAVYFQSSTQHQTSSPYAQYATHTPVQLLDTISTPVTPDPQSLVYVKGNCAIASTASGGSNSPGWPALCFILLISLGICARRQSLYA